MKLKLTLDPKAKHQDVATGVAWSNVETIFSCGDDHQLLMWNIVKNECIKVGELPREVYPTGIQWPPRSPSALASGSRKGSDLLLITATDGHFYLLGRGARVEKLVQAHKGAVLSGNWSSDGSEIMTSGEDGFVKIWSRAGMLRSIIAQCSVPIYSAGWSPDGQSVIHTHGESLMIRSTTPSTKPLEWKAHSDLILCVSWSINSNLIVSGGEDCRYKVWNHLGHLIFTSGTQANPVTSLSWSPDGSLFSIGAFNLIRLCDKYGWSHCMERAKIGSVYAMHWSSDGTQFSGVGAAGHVFLASVVEIHANWKTYDVVQSSRRTVTVSEFWSNTSDKLDFKDRILKLSLDYGFLICITAGSQIYIHNIANVNTPIICELKENYSISLILQSSCNFVLCGGLSVTVWTYEGRQICGIKWPGIRPDLIKKDFATIATDMIAFLDHSDHKLIRVFDPSSGKAFPEVRMFQESVQIALARNDYPGSTDRLLLVLDKNMDLHIALLKKYGNVPTPKRLTNQVCCVLWHTDAPMFACVREAKLRLYYFPQVIFIDQSLVDFTWEDKMTSMDLGKAPTILEYDSSRVSIRKPDGMEVTIAASPFMTHLHHHAINGKFNEARRTCRYVNNREMWGVMAGLAAWKQDLELAEICYSELGLFDKVLFIQQIKENSEDEPTRKAYMAVLCGNIPEAENILLQNKRISQAIEINVHQCRWERALEIAAANNQMIEYVVKARKAYLDNLGIKETIESYKNIAPKLSSARKRTRGTKSRTKSRKDLGEKINGVEPALIDDSHASGDVAQVEDIGEKNDAQMNSMSMEFGNY